MLVVDFKEDFKQQVTNDLKSFGADYDKNLDLDSNFFILLKTKRRIPYPQPRKIYYAKTFLVPKKHENGFAMLVNEILQGNDLRPRLSRKLIGKKIDKHGVDGALDDLGVIHFHLGENPLKGTKEIAFACVTDEAVYFIDVLEHGNDVWFDTRLVQIIHDNWSSLIAHRKLNIENDTNIPTAEERKVLRRKGITVPITVSDGTQYWSAGIGFMFYHHIKRGSYITLLDSLMPRVMKEHLSEYDTLVRQEERRIRIFLRLTQNEPLILKMSFDFHNSNFRIFEPIKNITVIEGGFTKIMR